MVVEKKFLCDEMLKRVGRWLRAAGYDTLIEKDGTPDRDLIDLAQREGRLLITRDTKMIEYRQAEDIVVLLKSNAVEECIAELSQRLSIDWLYRPFSRCLECNGLLEQIELSEGSGVPKEALERGTRAYRCAGCGKLYWEGSHVRRMRGKLEKWSKNP
jgi:hypothetical protein